MGIKISNLPPIVAPVMSDSFPVVQAGVTYKETITQLSTLLAAPANGFVVTNPAATQHILTNNFQVDAGIISSGIFSGGFQGSVAMFPSVANSGSLRFGANPNAGNFQIDITNASFGQATAISIPDPGSITANLTLAPFPLVSGNVVKASGTAGLLVDAGFALLANTTAVWGGGGVTNAFVATGISATSIVTATILASTNAVSIVKAVPSANTLTVTFSADPGAATQVSWISITPAV